MNFPWHEAYVRPTLNGPFVGYQWISGTQPTPPPPSSSPGNFLKQTECLMALPPPDGINDLRRVECFCALALKIHGFPNPK